jgi:hypothetical protein
MKANWRTWSPFQSPAVREICAHMTEDEKSEASRQSGLYGFWGAGTFALPLGFAIAFPNAAIIGVAVVLVTLHVVCIQFWRKMQRNFLCSTVWAREQGFTPLQLDQSK